MNDAYKESVNWNLEWPKNTTGFSRVLLISEGKVLMERDPSDPLQFVFHTHDVDSDRLFLAQVNDTSWYCSEVDADQVPDSIQLIGLRELASIDQHQFALASRATQLLRWHRTHQFCGTCGHQTAPGAGEHVLNCNNCNAIFYPKISPCVIVLIHKQDAILLARNIAHKDSTMFSLIAGFVEVGETVEQAVHREVMEEVGISVEDITYQGSQSWPFPSQLMLGFYAKYSSGTIIIQEDELLEADWYPITRLPDIPPELSIAGWMIQSFIRHKS